MQAGRQDRVRSDGLGLVPGLAELGIKGVVALTGLKDRFVRGEHVFVYIVQYLR